MRTHRRLEAWREARAVSVLVLRASRDHWKPWASALFAQLLRSSLSVQLNIAEGAVFGRSASYSRHLAIAYGSAVETGELIELLGEIEILPRELLDDLARHSALSQKLLVGLLKLHRPLR